MRLSPWASPAPGPPLCPLTSVSVFLPLALHPCPRLTPRGWPSGPGSPGPCQQQSRSDLQGARPGPGPPLPFLCVVPSSPRGGSFVLRGDGDRMGLEVPGFLALWLLVLLLCRFSCLFYPCVGSFVRPPFPPSLPPQIPVARPGHTKPRDTAVGCASFLICWPQGIWPLLSREV